MSFSVGAQEAPLEAPYTRSNKSGELQVRPIPKPEEITDDGEYLYGSDSGTGEIRYKIADPPPIEGAMFLRFGTIGPFDIIGDNGKTFRDVYSDKPSLVVTLDYEKQIGSLLGKWSYKISTGFTTEQGQGTFATIPNGVPSEKFLFLVMPNTIMANYKLRFSDTQMFIPYVEGGAGYFTFLERRDDGDRNAFGGAAVLSVTGGMLISLTSFSDYTKSLFYDDYGVKQLWLDLQFRRNVGLDDKKDFSSNMITGGFGFAF